LSRTDPAIEPKDQKTVSLLQSAVAGAKRAATKEKSRKCVGKGLEKEKARSVESCWSQVVVPKRRHREQHIQGLPRRREDEDEITTTAMSISVQTGMKIVLTGGTVF
jgi:hypothetical protein